MISVHLQRRLLPSALYDLQGTRSMMWVVIRESLRAEGESMGRIALSNA